MLERFVTQVFFGTSSESSVRRILLELSVGKMLFGMPSESRVPRRVTTQGLFGIGISQTFFKGFISSSWWFSGVNGQPGGQDGKCCIRCHLCHWSKPPRKATDFFQLGGCSRGIPSGPLEGSQEEYILDDFSEAVWKLWNWTTPVFSGYIFRYSSTSRFFQLHVFSRLSRWKNCTVRRTVCLGFAGQSMHWRR